MPDIGIQIPELPRFRSDLRKMGGGYHLALSKAHRDIARKVAERSSATASSQGGVAAKTAPSIKASGTLTRAAVKLGGDSYPFALGATFGAIQYPQFKAWRGNSEDAGYFLYPDIRAMQQEIADIYFDTVLDNLARIAFPN